MALKPPLAAPPSLAESKATPSTIERKAPGKGNKGDQINFQCSPELKREIKLMCAELGISQQDYLEKIHNAFYATLKGQK